MPKKTPPINPNKKYRKNRQQTGLPPGSLVFTGKQRMNTTLVHHLYYRADTIQKEDLNSKEGFTFQTIQTTGVNWIDIRGLHDTNLIERFGKQYKIHPLILEDVVDIYQRPKYEEYTDALFLTMRALRFDEATLKIKKEQVAFYYQDYLVLTFQEDDSDLFVNVRHRLANSHGRIRQRGADYLMYACIDELVDNYFLVLDEVGEYIEQFEDAILSNSNEKTKERMHFLKKELSNLRKAVLPLREAIGRFEKTDHPLLKEGTSYFVRDLYDHTIQVMDMVESYRDSLNSLQELYLSEVSFKMNQVMQVLTIVSTIFIPLSFLTGLYGMNFEYIPELKHPYGYFYLLGVMAVITIGLLLYFRRKKWL